MTNLILASGKGWLAFDKPQAMSVHNTDASNKELDVIASVRAILKTNPDLALQLKAEKDFAPAPVHRLDVGTSGILLVALNKDTARQLAEEFQNQRTTKIYTAVLKGSAPESILWSFPLTDRSEGRRDPAGRGPKKECHTEVHLIKKNEYFSLVEIHLLTGRTHQIRRHAALAKHPVVGDLRYGTEEFCKKIKELYRFDRMALHAEHLTICIDDEPKKISSPIPNEFSNLFKVSI